ncbi:MAG: hypothetical protein ACI3W7_00775 [Oscillospiraceae bacterium]
MRIRDWYFQGWERRIDENGKHCFVYTGEYYRFPDGIRKARIPAVCLTAALCALYLIIALLPSAGGMWHLAAAPQLLEIIPLLYLVMGAVCLLRAKEPLTFRDYHASWQRMRLSAYWSTGFTALMILAELAYLFLAAETISFPGEALYLLGELGCLALSILLIRCIKNHPCISSAQQTEEE